MFFVDKFSLAVCFITYAYPLTLCDMKALCFRLLDVSHEPLFALYQAY